MIAVPHLTQAPKVVGFKAKWAARSRFERGVRRFAGKPIDNNYWLKNRGSIYEVREKGKGVGVNGGIIETLMK